MFILSPDGTLLMASDENWFKTNFGGEKIQLKSVRDLLGKDRSKFIYNPVSGYNNKLVLLISRSYVDEKKQPVATLYTTTNIDLRTLLKASSILPGAESYFFTQEAGPIRVSGDQVLQMPENNGLSSQINQLSKPGETVPKPFFSELF